MKTIYTKEQLTEKLSSMKGWELKDDAIEKKFVLKDFTEALAFLVRIGIAAEKMDHHPEIFNVYNKVTIRLNTHSDKAITSLDTELAEKIDAIMK